MHDPATIVRTGRATNDDRVRQYGRPTVRPYVVKGNAIVWQPLGDGSRKRARLPRAV